MGDEKVATYNINSKKYDVYGCWDKDTKENEFSFYDLYLGGDCLNIGEPFFDEMPTRNEIIDYLDTINKKL